MDEHRCLEPSDYKSIANHLKETGNYTFPYHGGNGTAFIITILGPLWSVHLPMPWGGNPVGHFIVSLSRMGSFHFNFNEMIYPSYVEEKLGLTQSDAQVICDLLNHIRGLL